MADSHGAHDSHGSSKGHDAHAHHEPEEDPIRTPGYVPLLGLGVFLVGALWMYLYVSPGVWAPPAPNADGDGGAPTEQAAPAAPAH